MSRLFHHPSDLSASPAARADTLQFGAAKPDLDRDGF